jgi:hypothetical protein
VENTEEWRRRSNGEGKDEGRVFGLSSGSGSIRGSISYSHSMVVSGSMSSTEQLVYAGRVLCEWVVVVVGVWRIVKEVDVL